MQLDSKNEDCSALGINIAVICGNLEDLEKIFDKTENRILIQYVKENKPIFFAIYFLDKIFIGNGDDSRRLKIFDYLLKKMIELDQELINLYDNRGYTALHSAIIHNRLDLILKLAEVNIDLKAPKCGDYKTTIDFARMRLSQKEFAEFQVIIKENYPKKGYEDIIEVKDEIRSRKSLMFTEKQNKPEILNVVNVIDQKLIMERAQKESKNIEEDHFQITEKVRGEQKASAFGWFVSLFGIKIRNDENRKILDETESEFLIKHKME